MASVLNTDANISGDTLLTAENTQTVTGATTFSRAPSAPFAVSAGSAVVANLDADKVDGYEASALAVLAENETISGNWTTTGQQTWNKAGTQLTVQNGSGTTVGVMGETNTGLFIQFVEGSTDASNPAANRATLYARDNGLGKTQLVVRFNTGAVQVLATEP